MQRALYFRLLNSRAHVVGENKQMLFFDWRFLLMVKLGLLFSDKQAKNDCKESE